MTRVRRAGIALVLALFLAPWAGAARAQSTEFKVVRSARVIWWADLAYDSVNAKFLVVWVTEEAIFGQFIEPAGTLVGTAFKISAGKGHYYPRVAFGNGRFLVVYSYALGGGRGIDYRARFLTFGDPPTVDPPFTLDHPARFTQPGAVAYVAADDYFLVLYPKKKGTQLRQVFDFESYSEPQVVTDIKSPCALNIPDIALNTNQEAGENVALITGWRDPTSPGCRSGIWYDYIDAAGLPVAAGQPGFVIEKGGIAREQKAVFNANTRQFLLQWSHRPKGVVQGILRGHQFDLTQQVGETYELQAPVLDDEDYGNNGFGEAALAYEPTTDKFLLAMRGADKSGPAPIWKKHIGGDGQPVADTLGRLSLGQSTAPYPLIGTDGAGVVLAIYRGYYKINGIATTAAAWLDPPPAKPKAP